MFKKKENMILGLFIAILLALAFAWTLQLGFHMEPCSLCLLQRAGLYLAGFILLIDYILIKALKKNFWLNHMLDIISLAGISFSLSAALRQTYIQMLPADQVPSCGADLNTLLQMVPVLEAIKKVFQGSGECAEKALVVLHLSLANWSAILLMIFFIVNLIVIFKKK